MAHKSKTVENHTAVMVQEKYRPALEKLVILDLPDLKKKKRRRRLKSRQKINQESKVVKIGSKLIFRSGWLLTIN
jgi:hypothetical protein